MKRSFNIALLGRDFVWSGGTEFLRNLANALLAMKDESQIRLFLLLPVRKKVDTFADLRGIILRTGKTVMSQRNFTPARCESAFNLDFHDYFKNVDGEIEIVEYNEATGLISALQRIGADAVLPAASSLGETFPFPWVGYVYDFQHKYFPNYFSAKECMDRDIYFATMLRDAKAIIVNAKSVKDDIEKFFPYCECEVFNLPFSAAPVSSWLEDSTSELLGRFKLPQRYFLISNQFWIHKSHITAFRALAEIVKDQICADIHIVCTGKMEDYRFPDYIRNLQREISALGIENRVHFLGHIPKIDQVAIMKNSLGVLQPTLFEGGPGGGSVYDAVSLGVPAIVSNIPVNREIEMEKNIFYFKSESVTDLAGQLKVFLSRDIRRPAKESLIFEGANRKRQLGKRILQAVHYVKRKQLL